MRRSGERSHERRHAGADHDHHHQRSPSPGSDRGASDPHGSGIEHELLPPGIGIAPDDDLLSGELLDSIAIVRLATFVQNEFGVDLQSGGFVVENFRSVNVLAGFVERSEESPPGS